jgi:long-chain acyl-CoA synthetase
MATVREITHQFSDSGAAAVIAWAGIAAKPVEVLKENKAALKKVIIFRVKGDESYSFSGDVLKYEDIVSAAPDTEPDVSVSSKDLAMLQYTGGTTGVSKGCMLSNFNVLSQAFQDHEWFKGSYESEPYLKTLCCMPLYHIYGFNTNININKVAGGCSILVTEPTVDNILAAVNQNEPNFYAAVPAMIFGLNQHPATPYPRLNLLRDDLRFFTASCRGNEKIRGVIRRHNNRRLRLSETPMFSHAHPSVRESRERRPCVAGYRYPYC